jgi:MFS superfamily sulfate permease-like transporter
MKIAPKTGFKGLVENWQSDLIAAVSVALVALPLSLGIGFAAGLPPISGVFTAIIGGVVTTLVRGSHIGINGPSAGIIAAILTSIAALDDGSGNAINYVFAAIFVSGVLQTFMGILRMGRFADLFHSTIIHGILAAIGVIIFAKQIHLAMGIQTEATSVVDTLVDAVRQVPNINPFVACISVLGLILLLYHSRISYKLFHLLPAPMWVLALSIPIVYLFNYFDPHSYTLFGREYFVGPDLLISIPDNITDALIFPNFSKIGTMPFWTSVLAITMISSIESLASSKAVDKLDPYKRKTNLNKDLVGIGLSTMVSGALGGLPIITVIVRSTVNVHNHAKTKWSNMYHGLLLLLIIFVLAPVIQKVPLAALAIMLVYTGFKLASPKVFKQVYSHGLEQLILFVGTLIITLFTNLLIGIFGGLALALISHMLIAQVPLDSFFKMLFKSGTDLQKNRDGSYNLNIKGVANFLSTINIDNLMNKIPAGADVKINLSEARLVDFSIMEHIHDFQRVVSFSDGKAEITGLENHTSFSSEKLSLKVNKGHIHKVTSREIKLQDVCNEHGLQFESESENQVEYFQTFYFFKSRPIDLRFNTITNKDYSLMITDVIFEEGAIITPEQYKTTLGQIKFPFDIPKFTIEKLAFPERYFNLAMHKDIDYFIYPDFSDKFVVKVEDIEGMSNFLTDEIKELVENSEVIHHLESNGEAVLLFTDNLRLALVKDIPEFIRFARRLSELINTSHSQKPI